MDNIFMHIDVNNAFLSWTAVDLLKNGYNIDIRNIDAVIGGDEKARHGIVLAKSIPAKKKGVNSAETLMEARRKCKNLNVYPPNYNLYTRYSKAFFNLIGRYTPDIEVLSIDECFIDYSKVQKLYGDPIKFAYKLKSEIKEKLGFTVNIGIANNKLCAKMASDFLKPDRVHTLFLNEIEEKMYPLPIEDLYGVGKSTSKKLRELNINTISDLANSNPNILYKYFKNQTNKLINSAKGIDDSVIMVKRKEAEGISNSITLDHNLISIEQINKNIYSLVENIGLSLRNKNKYTSLIGVILKDKYFNVYSHRKKLKNPTNNTDEIYSVVKELVKELWNGESVRLIGVSARKFSSSLNHQISMFEDIKVVEKNNELEKIVDKLRFTYGKDIINKASQLKKSQAKNFK